MRMRATILATAGLLAIATPAGALFDTKTNGYICTNHCPDYSFGTFSAQTFKGATRPSRSDQTVNFYYRREGTNEWHRFGREDPEGTSPAFKSLDGHAHAHIKNDNRWRFEFSAYKEGRWVLMAKFVRQDGYAASSVRRHVTVHYSE